MVSNVAHARTLHEPADLNLLPQHRLKLPKTNLIPAVCFYNGSFVPIHAGHVNVLQEAKRYIDSLGTHELLGAFISPSHSGYVRRKLGENEFISIGHRLAMIYLAIENLDWVMVDLFEAFQQHHTALQFIMTTFIKRVRSQLPGNQPIEVFWLQGEDSLLFGASDSLHQCGFHSLFIINRHTGDGLIDLYEKHWKTIRELSMFPERIHLVQATNLNLSSTAIRKFSCNAEINREQLHQCTQLDCITNYILQHHLWNPKEITSPSSSLTIFPETINDLTPEMLSSMLVVSFDQSIRVISFDTERIGIGKGWGGPIYRLHHISYAADDVSVLPASMVLKLSTGIWNGSSVSSEPDFYTQLAPRVTHVEIPRCYYTVRHPENRDRVVLLLEDLSENCHEIRRAIRNTNSSVLTMVAALGALHAEFFKQPMLKNDAFLWLPSPYSKYLDHQKEYAVVVGEANFMALVKERFSDKVCEYAKALHDRIPELFRKLTEDNYTLCHGDFWLNNIFVRKNQPHRLVVLDWQTCCRANGLIDLAFIMCLITRKRAHALETQVLELYHTVLMKYGVLNYCLSDIETDYYTMALPYMFTIICGWKHRWIKMYDEILLLLQDISGYEDKYKTETFEESDSEIDSSQER